MSETTGATGLLPDGIPPVIVGGFVPELPDRKKTRATRKLAWNERQYGAGVVAGVFIGVCIGIPVDAILAILARLFVNWLLG